MRHCGVVRAPNYEGSKKIPLNTVVLPPLSPNILEGSAQLILVNKAKSNVGGEVLTLSRSQDGTPRIIERSPDNVRIAQLEQNIKFLQDQHQVMLNDLHNEIESLRNKNRDLQFQLIFNKTTPTSPQTSPSTSSSSDDEHKEEEQDVQIVSSPNQPTFTSSLQVELLEKSIGDLKIQLQENDSRNVYLSAIVDEQKKKLEKYERDRERERERAVQAEPELRRKVEEADAIIRRLQQEINTLRREGSNSVSPSHYHQRENYNPQRGGDSQHHSRENHGHREHRENGTYQKNGRGNRRNNSMNYRGNWFPPLHSQNYWQGGGNRGNQEKKNNSENGLPNMNNGQQQHQERRGGNNNHYNHNGDGVRHRGSQNKGGDAS